MLNFRKYPLFWKLTLPMLLVTLVWGGIVLIAAYRMKIFQTRIHNLHTDNVTFVLQLQALGGNLSRLNNLLLLHVSSVDGKETAGLSEKVYAQQEAIESDFKILEKSVLANHGNRTTAFVQSHKSYYQYMKINNEIIRLSEDLEKPVAFEMLRKLIADFQHPINEALANILSLELELMQSRYKQSQHLWHKNIVFIAGGGGAVFLLTLAFLYLLIRKITRRMGLVVACVESLRTGDLSARIEPGGCDDEITRLGDGLTAMAEEIEQSTVMLQESEAQVRMLLDSTAEAIYGTNVLGQCTFSNKACLEMLGYDSASELLGKNIHELVHHSHADGTPFPIAECPICNLIRTGREAHRDEEVLWRKDGSKFQVEYRAHPIRKGEEVIGAVVSFLDITERIDTEEALKRSHDLLNDAQEIGHIGSWEWDIKNNTLHWADEMYRIFGFSPQEFAASYELFLAVVHPEDRELVEDAVQEALAGRTAYNINHRILLADGSERIVNEKGRVGRDELGNPISMIGTIQDITEIKTIENNLRTYQEKLEELVSERTMELQMAKDEADKANQAKSLFLSSMSHELRTPLNSILGFGQLLFTDKKNPLSSAQKEHLRNVLKSGSHLLALIDDVLNLSKIETGAMTISLKPVEYYAVVSDVVELVQEIAKNNHVAILTEEPANPVFINVDETRFQQVIMNLVSNAIKYNRPGGTVSIACNERDEWLRIKVSDTGQGISAEKSKLLFEPFTRLGAETSSIEGTGIGLTITKRLVELMNGRIDYESEVGNGSRFWVDFPIASGEVEGSASLAKVKSSVPLLPKGNYTILYVEDNQYNRDLLSAILARTPSLTLLMAENGKQGVEMAHQDKPDLVLMDIGLPDMDGFATLQELQGDPETENIPVVALSGNAMPMDIEKALQAGFAGYITKPFNIAGLYQVLGEVITKLSQADPEQVQ